jgi:hypothetical protein
MGRRTEHMQKRLAILATAGVWLAVSAAMAQAAPQSHIRGTIQTVGENSLTIATRDGQTVTVALKQPLRVSTVKRLDISSIRAGTFIGAAARPGPNGGLVAMEVVVFPESLRGTGEGNYPWDLAPGTSMVNANISALVENNMGRDLTLNYKGSSTKVLVPPDVPIVQPAPAQQADLKPGAPVLFTPTRAADGSLSTARVIVGKNGVAPPM